MQQQISILGQRTFAEWVTTGLFYVEDEAPEVAASLAEAVAGYDAAGCDDIKAFHDAIDGRTQHGAF